VEPAPPAVGGATPSAVPHSGVANPCSDVRPTGSGFVFRFRDEVVRVAIVPRFLQIVLDQLSLFVGQLSP